MMMFDWTTVIEIALFAVVAIVAAAVVPWVKERIGAERFNTLWKWVCTAVQAAEQLFGSGKGGDKKAYVEEFLAAHGYDVIEEVNNMIEAAVRELTD